jgi:anti-anti-sigma regulatory factor
MKLLGFSDDRGSRIRIEPQGALSCESAKRLHLIMTEVVIQWQPDDLHVSLLAVTALGDSGLDALIAGYVLAVDYGVRYYVTDVGDALRRSLQWAVVLDALADSDDLDALLLTMAALERSKVS